MRRELNWELGRRQEAEHPWTETIGTGARGLRLDKLLRRAGNSAVLGGRGGDKGRKKRGLLPSKSLPTASYWKVCLTFCCVAKWLRDRKHQEHKVKMGSRIKSSQSEERPPAEMRMLPDDLLVTTGAESCFEF
jgi:hypothetical protein